jgi:hypothetical protein
MPLVRRNLRRHRPAVLGAVFQRGAMVRLVRARGSLEEAKYAF